MIVVHRLDDRRERTMRAKAWEGCGPEATVTLRKPYALFRESGRVEVNWGCCGGVEPGDAEKFAEMMAAVVAIAKQWEAELPGLREAEDKAVAALNALAKDMRGGA